MSRYGDARLTRVKVVQFCYFSVIALIVLRLWYWQIWRSDDLVARAEDQSITQTTVQAPRGSILFSDGTVLASIQPKYLIYAEPKVISDKQLVAKTLAEEFYSEDSHPDITNDDQKNAAISDLENTILGRISQNLYWVSLGRTVDYQT